MIRLDDIEAFLAVVRAGSFVGAARETGAPVSTLSRRVAALEQRLKTQLLKRSTRSLTLTDDGRSFADRCGAAMAEIAAASAALCERDATLRGPLRVTAPQYACNEEFGPLLLDFAARHPELELDLRLTNGTPDLIEENVDLAFHLTPLPESSHVARKLWTIPYVLCASPKLNRPLRHPRELAAQPCVLTAPITVWRFDHPAEGQVAVSPKTLGARVDDLGLGARAVRAGLGYGFLPRGLVEAELGDSLQEVPLNGWQAQPRDLYALYPQSRRLSPKVRALIDFALEARAAHR
jgi:DNA-binding transcriptional LysR family regulator